MPRRPLLVPVAILAIGLGAGCAAHAPLPAARYESPPPSVLSGVSAPSYGVTVDELQARPANALTESVAVRHRSFSGSSVIGNLFSGSSSVSTVAATAQVVSAAVQAPEKLVVESWIRLQADDVAKTAAAVHARVEADGGRVVSSNLIGEGGQAQSAAIELRVPPGKTAELIGWLDSLGEIESKRTLASDVGKLMFDQELALKNLELTMARLQKLIEKDVPVKELLEIEKEMTRVRGEIERVKGEQRWLGDRVALATVTLTIVREPGLVRPSPSARMFPGPRVSLLSLIDPDGRPATRIGGGVTVHVNRAFTLDFDVFPRKDGDSRAVLATAGTALYSSFLGGGGRRFLNPYFGMRLGYGYLSDRGAFAMAGELGLELFKHRYVLVEVAGRAVAFVRDGGTEGAFTASFGASVPF